VARKLADAGSEHRIATGITPSGHIHVGNMREILTGDIVHRAVSDLGLKAQLFYLADDFDPLRKVYPFLPGTYEAHVGKPLSRIPSPDGRDISYAQYFLEPFLRSLDRLGVRPTVLRSSESYLNGSYSEATAMVLDASDRVKSIIERISKRALEDDWLPYTPICSSCGRLSTTKALGWERPFVTYSCRCGHEGRADTRTDDGKLPWRLDWPARWFWLGVTVEPFGKDHASSGGSYDTASEIAREVFDMEPPFPIVYEWIQLKGRGAMHSSTGVVVTGTDMLRMTPPEVLRFFVARSQPTRHLDMDPGMGILALVDDFDRYEMEYLQKGMSEGDPDDPVRTYLLSLSDPLDNVRVHPDMVHVPYRHLVTLVQISDDIEVLLEKVKRSMKVDSIDPVSRRHIEQRIDCVRFWLERFAPEEVKFSLVPELTPEMAERLDEESRMALHLLKDGFSNIEWDAEAIHSAMYDISRGNGLDPKVSFRALYRVLLDAERGPRLGFFLSTMEKEEVISRLEKAISMVD